METANRINELSEKHREYTAQILSRMVRVKGYSGHEKERCELIVELCREAGFDEVFIDGLGSVVGRIGHGPRKLAFDAHIDSVEVGDITQWEKDPFSGQIADGRVYGLGSNDQLGGAACMIASARMLKELGYDGDFTIYYTFTVMEEDCDGLCWLYLIGEEGLRPDFVVSTEPSNRNIYRGHRGRMEIEIQLKGVSAHGSVPHLGASAAYKASRAALAIEQLDKDLQPDEERFLGKGSVTVSGMSVTGPSQCSVPDEATLYLDRRLTWGENAEIALGQVTNAVAKAIGEAPFNVYMPRYSKRGYKNVDFTQELYFPTWKIPADHALCKAACKAYEDLFHIPVAPKPCLYSTNAVAFAGRYQIPAVVMGPGDATLSHKANEKNEIDELVMFSAMYTLLPYLL